MAVSRRPESLLGQVHASIAPAAKSAPWDIVFLDRDGTLNRQDAGYRKVVDFELLNGATDGVRLLNELGVRVVLATNQRGLATGRLSGVELTAVHAVLVQRLGAAGAFLDDIRVCPHDVGQCQCRKPGPKMLLDTLAANPWAHADRCIFVGDSETDRQAAKSAGIGYFSILDYKDLPELVSYAAMFQ